MNWNNILKVFFWSPFLFLKFNKFFILLKKKIAQVPAAPAILQVHRTVDLSTRWGEGELLCVLVKRFTSLTTFYANNNLKMGKHFLENILFWNKQGFKLSSIRVKKHNLILLWLGTSLNWACQVHNKHTRPSWRKVASSVFLLVFS